MKVICIDDKWETLPPGGKKLPAPVFGEIVTVSKAFRCGKFHWYTLLEYSNTEYEQCAFIPLSFIDETTFDRYETPEHSYDYE